MAMTDPIAGITKIEKYEIDRHQLNRSASIKYYLQLKHRPSFSQQRCLENTDD
jgi:hypothetical protein